SPATWYRSLRARTSTAARSADTVSSSTGSLMSLVYLISSPHDKAAGSPREQRARSIATGSGPSGPERRNGPDDVAVESAAPCRREMRGAGGKCEGQPRENSTGGAGLPTLGELVRLHRNDPVP